MSNLSHNERIDKAIEDLNSSDKLNYAATARKWGIERTTLAKRHKGQTGIHNAATSGYRKKLSNAQELELLKHIRVF